MTTKKANKIVWVERWNRCFGGNDSISAEKIQDGKWVCKIKLPLIKKTIKVTSKTEVNAMLNSADKAVKLIKEHINEHKEIEFPPLSSCRYYEIVGNENGEYQYKGLTDEGRKKNGAALLKIKEESLKAVQKAIARIRKINRSTKNMFIQAIDRSLFPEEMNDKEIAFSMFEKNINQNDNYASISVEVRDGFVISVGYSLNSIKGVK